MSLFADNKIKNVVMTPIDKITNTENLFNVDFSQTKQVKNDNTSKDSIEISDSAKVFSNIDKFFNLDDPNRLDLSNLNETEKKDFMDTLASLLKKGFMGYETLKVKGKVEKHFIETEIGDERLKGAKHINKDTNTD
jgi:DNA replication protein DnaD